MLNALLLSAHAAPLPVTTTSPRKLQGGVSVSFTCADIAGRTNLIDSGAFCYQLDDSHPGTLSSISSSTGGGMSCADYYITTAGGSKVCYLNGNKCKASDLVTGDGCPTLPQYASLGRTNLKSITSEEVWCYMLDSSHPDVLARHGACEDYFYTDDKHPGKVNYCTMTDGMCKPSETWTTVANAPPVPPSPAPPPPPPPPTRCTDDPTYVDVW